MTILWLIFGIFLLFLEMCMPIFVLVFFGLGALIVSGTLFFTENTLAFQWQMLLFLGMSCILLLLFRKKIQSKKETTAVEQHHLIGMQGCVTKAIHAHVLGEIEIEGSFWKAKSTVTILPGTAVTVLSVEDGLILKVDKFLQV